MSTHNSAFPFDESATMVCEVQQRDFSVGFRNNNIVQFPMRAVSLTHCLIVIF